MRSERNKLKEFIKKYIEEGSEARNSVDIERLSGIGEEISRRVLNESMIFVMGNGGSAADAQHFVAELVGRFEKERRPVPAVALTTNTSILTAISNDYDYSEVFARQVKALAKKGDIVFGISTSGNSKNVIRGVEEANEIGCFTVSLTGSKGALTKIAKENIMVNSQRTSIIQEAHIMIIHILSKIIEDAIDK
jgi:D-sedoheptulose 7-phosphate isomerase